MKNRTSTSKGQINQIVHSLGLFQESIETALELSQAMLASVGFIWKKEESFKLHAPLVVNFQAEVSQLSALEVQILKYTAGSQEAPDKADSFNSAHLKR